MKLFFKIIGGILLLIILLFVIHYFSYAHGSLDSISVEVEKCSLWHEHHNEEGMPKGVNYKGFENSNDVISLIAGNMEFIALSPELLENHSLKITLATGSKGVGMVLSERYNPSTHCVLPQGPENSVFLPMNRSWFSDVGFVMSPLSYSEKQKPCVIFTANASAEELQGDCNVIAKNTSGLWNSEIRNNDIIMVSLDAYLDEDGYEAVASAKDRAYKIEYTKK